MLSRFYDSALRLYDNALRLLMRKKNEDVSFYFFKSFFPNRNIFNAFTSPHREIIYFLRFASLYRRFAPRREEYFCIHENAFSITKTI